VSWAGRWPGEYTLNIAVSGPVEDARYGLGSGPEEITIPERRSDNPDAPVDLGELEVKPKPAQ